ncbi:MAG: hypothetical protein ABI627_22075 [Polyangiaceae bacterium]
MNIGRYACVGVGVVLAALTGCSSEPLKGAGTLDTKLAPGSGVSETGSAETEQAFARGPLKLQRFAAANARTHVEHLLEAGSEAIAISGHGPLEVSAPSFPSTEVGDAVSVDIVPPTFSANPAWTGQLQVFVSDAQTEGGKRYVGGYGLTALPRGRTSRISIPIHPSLKPLFQNGGRVSFVQPFQGGLRVGPSTNASHIVASIQGLAAEGAFHRAWSLGFNRAC